MRRRFALLPIGLACFAILIGLGLRLPAVRQAALWFQLESNDQKRMQVKSQMAQLTHLLELYPPWQQDLLKQPTGYARHLEPMLTAISGLAIPEPDQPWRETVLQAQQFLGELKNPYTGQTGPDGVFADWERYARQVKHPEQPLAIPPEFQGKVLYRPLKCTPVPQTCQGFVLYTLFRGGKPMPWKESFLP